MAGASEPLVTVVMAVHNGGVFLRGAIESILAQTYRDFRLLIVDDASTDDSRQIVRSYADPRIDQLALERNAGQTAALHIGVRRARTPWIARMDADDYAAPSRLAEQMTAVERDPALRCVGTFAWIFRENPGMSEGLLERPVDDEAIKRALYRSTPMIHGSLLIHREAMLSVGGYEDRFRYSADRELYRRFVPRFRCANIPTPLLGIRQHPGQGSLSRRAADESVEIIRQMLIDCAHAEPERSDARQSLALAYRFRARCWASEQRYPEMMKDLAHAVWLSPRAVLSPSQVATKELD